MRRRVSSLLEQLLLLVFAACVAGLSYAFVVQVANP
jgi:hypothetical protein